MNEDELKKLIDGFYRKNIEKLRWGFQAAYGNIPADEILPCINQSFANIIAQNRVQSLSFGSEAKFRNYVNTAIRNTLNDWLRRARRQIPVQDEGARERLLYPTSRKAGSRPDDGASPGATDSGDSSAPAADPVFLGDIADTWARIDDGIATRQLLAGFAKAMTVRDCQVLQMRLLGFTPAEIGAAIRVANPHRLINEVWARFCAHLARARDQGSEHAGTLHVDLCRPTG
jgi:DNA-directed RNA polymerase specialized sigma24 family protein